MLTLFNDIMQFYCSEKEYYLKSFEVKKSNFGRLPSYYELF